MMVEDGLKYFETMEEAFDYCREAQRPVVVRIRMETLPFGSRRESFEDH